MTNLVSGKLKIWAKHCWNSVLKASHLKESAPLSLDVDTIISAQEHKAVQTGQFPEISCRKRWGSLLIVRFSSSWKAVLTQKLMDLCRNFWTRWCLPEPASHSRHQKLTLLMDILWFLCISLLNVLHFIFAFAKPKILLFRLKGNIYQER